MQSFKTDCCLVLPPQGCCLNWSGKWLRHRDFSPADSNVQPLKYSRDSLDTNIGMCFKSNSYIPGSRPVPTVLPLPFLPIEYILEIVAC